jgi:hypothetical protein
LEDLLWDLSMEEETLKIGEMSPLLRPHPSLGEQRRLT